VSTAPRLGCLIAVAAISLWFLRGWSAATFPQIVAAGEKPNGPNYAFGYSVGAYRWGPGFRVQIWADSRVRISFNIEGEELVRVKTQRWLASDRAVLLEFDCVHHNSIRTAHEMGLLYDFERGELYSLGRYHGWLVPPPGETDRRTNREDFDAAVQRLSKGTAR
jgi:hypothetical protein